MLESSIVDRRRRRFTSIAGRFDGPLDVWAILIAEQPFLEKWHIAIQYCPDLNGEDCDHGILCTIG
jgi:hypothetical protein